MAAWLLKISNTLYVLNPALIMELGTADYYANVLGQMATLPVSIMDNCYLDSVLYSKILYFAVKVIQDSIALSYHFI